jgi:hypothetical protein
MWMVDGMAQRWTVIAVISSRLVRPAVPRGPTRLRAGAGIGHGFSGSLA